MPTARADIAFGPSRRGMDGVAVEGRVRRAMAATGSEGLADRPPWTLSGGEQRSVSLAAVLAMEPSILLLDEPSSGLDPASRRSLIRVLREIEGIQVVATHDLDLVLDVCDRVIVLARGRLAICATRL